MKTRGILFSVMVLFLALMLITLGMATHELTSKRGKDFSQLTAHSKTNNLYATIEESIINLGKESVAKSAFERILPFDYVIDGNTLLISQKLPLHQITLNNYFDIINSYAIFVADRDFQTTYDNILVDINTIQNSAWDGNTNKINFLLMPQCMIYTVADLNQMQFQESTSAQCLTDFNVSNIARYDLGISIKAQLADYNSVSCSFAGTPGCPNSSYDPENQQPYFNLFIDDSLCVGCDLTAEQKQIATHYPPTAQNTITIECVGANCSSAPIQIRVSAGPSILHDADRTDVNIMATFRNSIESLRFADFNFSLTNQDFNIFQANLG